MSTIRTILPTKNNPLLCLNYPMFHGAYCPHVIYQQQTSTDARKSEPEHRETVFASQLLNTPNGQEWSKPKQKSHSNATICLILLDANKTPTVSSIHILPTISPLQYAGHPDYQPRTSLSINERNTMPSTEDLYQFVVNPSHCFTNNQIGILRHALLRSFPSNHPQFIQASAKLDECSANPNFSEFPTLPVQALPNIPAPTQIVLTSETNPWLIPNYPDTYGVTEQYRFYLHTSQKPGCIRKEIVYSQSLNRLTNMWSPPKRRTPAKSTICILLRDNNPLSPTFGLPSYNFVDLNSKETNPSDIYQFALRHYFTIEQRALLTLYLTKHFGAESPEVTGLLSLWASQPAVPSAP